MAFTWYKKWSARTALSAHKATKKRQSRRTRLALEPLETRVVPAVILNNNFQGINAPANGPFQLSPPDTTGAVGPNSYIEMVNVALQLYGKDGSTIDGPLDFGTFFASSPSIQPFGAGDPIIVYNEITQKFFAAQFDFDDFNTVMVLDVAISKTNDPQSLSPADWDFFQYDVNDKVGASFVFADYPKLGYNADGYVVSFNMFPAGFDHVSTISIRNDGTSPGIKVVPGGNTRFTLAPASMHTAAPGDPMWFVTDGNGSGGGNTVDVVRMDNPFSATPTYTFMSIDVAAYGNAPNPRQPSGSLGNRTSLGTRFYFSGLRTTTDGVTHLVSAHAVGANGGARARWYDFDVSNPTAPTLIQEGQIDNGTGVDTYFPTIDIAPNGKLGMTFAESSSSEFMSVYIVGRQPGDPLGTMDCPVLVKPGEANLVAFGRAGDYSMTTIDPVDGTFWIAQEYATADVSPNWGTWVANFDIGVGTSSLTGVKFFDFNQDRVRNAGEPGLSGWVIFADFNNNGIKEACEPSATTDVNGNYTITGLAHGTYRLREIQQSGWTQTTPNPAPVVLGDGETLPGGDFGNFTPPSLKGTVFDDTNGNSFKNAGEPGLPGWTVFLDTNNNGMLDPTETRTLTDSAGAYAFNNLLPGTYRVREVLKADYVQTLAPPPTVVLVAGSSFTINIGNFQLFDLNGQVFDDTNGNSAKNPGEPGLGGWTVYIDENNDSDLDWMDGNGNGFWDAGEGERWITTTPGGNYFLTNLGPITGGTYFIRELPMSGFVQTTGNPSFPQRSGVDRTSQNFGNFKLVTLSGLAFEDQDGDGFKQPGEVGVGGWVIELDRGANGSVDATTTTAADGSYSFSDLGVGTYRLREQGQANWLQTSTNPADVAVLSGTNVGNLNFGNFLRFTIDGTVFNDLNGDGVLGAGDAGLAGRVVKLDRGADGTIDATSTTDATGSYSFGPLGPGIYRLREAGLSGWSQTTTNPADINARSGVNVSGTTTAGLNFGTFQLASISGLVFDDFNGDGSKSGDLGVAGRVVQLDKDANGTVDATATTDASGFYTLPNLGAGTYRVREAGQPNWVQTTTNPSDFVITSGFGAANVDFGTFQRTSISGQVFNDVFGNGAKDTGDAGLAGRVVYLDTDADGMLDSGETTATTDANGFYTFPSLGPGTYRVRETGQPNWLQTTTNPADVPARSGQPVTDRDFGSFQRFSISGSVFDDANGNGIRTTGEAGVAGRLVELELGGTPAGTATTTASGAYSFSNLGPGTYRVREAGLSGWSQTTGDAILVGQSGIDNFDVSFGTFKRFTIAGVAFNDRFGEGTLDANDKLLQDWVIELDVNADGTADATATTDAAGGFSFSDLGPDINNLGPLTYRVREQGQAGWLQTSTNPSDIVSRSGQDVTNLTFGNFAFTSISGTVFDDLDGSGSRDAGEPGLPGIVVFFDADNDNTLDTGEAAVTTDAGGAFSFDNLGPGTYRVRVQAPPGAVLSTPGRDIVAESGTPTLGVDLGNFLLATITGSAFEDNNGNGTQDTGDPVRAGWVVFLDANNSGGLDSGEVSTTTAADGSFTFSGLGAGTYRVLEQGQTGWLQTTTNPAAITPRSGEVVSGVTFGNFKRVRITGSVFEDRNGDQARGSGDPGTAGRVVFLDADNDGALDSGETSTTTVADGTFTFSDLGPGTFRVREQALASWQQTTTNPTDIVTSSGVNASGVTFGNFKQFSISGRVFQDGDGNGIDTGEGGIGGRTVFLDADNDGTLDTGETRVTTAADGTFTFSNLGPGTYRVRQVTPAGWLATSDVAPVVGSSGVNVSTGLSLGSFKTYSLSGTVFNDLVGNGTRDVADAGVGFRTVFLDADGSGGLSTGDPSTVTDAAGNFSFTNLGPGTFSVRLLAVPGVLVTRVPQDGFGISGIDVAGLDFGTFRTITISGRVYRDRAIDGTDNGGSDPGLGSVTVTLARDANGNGTFDAGIDPVVTTATTDSNGGYAFSALGPGNYLVVQAAGGDRVQFTPSGGYAIAATSGVDVSGRDFGDIAGANDIFVFHIYADLLNRTPDPAGFQAWLTLINQTGTRDGVVRGIESSLEFKTKQINDAYFELLDRPADPAGLAAGFALMANQPIYVGARPGIEQLRLMILGSPEYFLKQGGNTNAGFIDALFRDVLGRPADAFALQAFLPSLNSGVSRLSVARTVVGSTEAAAHFVQDSFQEFLRRDVDAAGLASFLNALSRGTKEEDVLFAIFTSEEYYNLR